MVFKVEEQTKGERIKKEDLKTYGKKEMERVSQALEEARKKLVDIVACPSNRENKAKIKELDSAINIGTMYLNKLKRKWLI
jgi:hypothetical protein